MSRKNYLLTTSGDRLLLNDAEDKMILWRDPVDYSADYAVRVPFRKKYFPVKIRDKRSIGE